MSLWCFYNSSHCIELVCCQPDIFVVFHYSPRHNSAHMLVLSHSRQYYTLHGTRVWQDSLSLETGCYQYGATVPPACQTELPTMASGADCWPTPWLFLSRQRNEMETLVRTLSQCPISHPCMCTVVKDDSRKKTQWCWVEWGALVFDQTADHMVVPRYLWYISFYLHLHILADLTRANQSVIASHQTTATVYSCLRNVGNKKLLLQLSL